MVADRIVNSGLNWDGKSIPISEDQVRELSLITSWVGDTKINKNPDKWICIISPNGNFHVDCMRQNIDKPSNLGSVERIEWIPEIPNKVACFVSRENMEKIPTTTGLVKRGVQKHEIHCGLCLDTDETTQHVFITCSYARVVWD